MPRLVQFPLVALALAFSALCPRAALAQTSREYDLKAVLVYNFAQFVEWPASAFPSSTAPLVIGILGHDPFGRVLDDLVKQEPADRRRIVIERHRSLDTIGHCHILFIEAGEQRNFPRILAALRGRPVLTVGDFDDFALRGGMIRFLKNPADKITLRINLEAARAAGLNISAQLLRVAEVVPQPRT